MLVTGVQAVGSKGVTAVQGTVVDTTRERPNVSEEVERGAGRRLPGDPQPVVFPRNGLPLDGRPVGLRKARAANRYRSDGGGHDEAA